MRYWVWGRAPGDADQVGDVGGNQGRNHGVELDPVHVQLLQREDRAG